jgi:hypothetical protein
MNSDYLTSANTRRYYYNDNWQVLCEHIGRPLDSEKFVSKLEGFLDRILFPMPINQKENKE